MTRFTVVWVESARDELAELWLNAPDRHSVTAAADAIDRVLVQDPLIKGTELREGIRTLFMPPLRVLFTTREEDRVVEVLRVRYV